MCIDEILLYCLIVIIGFDKNKLSALIRSININTIILIVVHTIMSQLRPFNDTMSERAKDWHGRFKTSLCARRSPST